MTDAPEEYVEPLNLKVLRRLVTILMIVMIAGIVVLVGLFVTRFPAMGNTQILIPSKIALPEGATATAFTKGVDWYAVVTSENQILIYDATTQALTQTIAIKP